MEVLGGETSEYQVIVDPARLGAYGLSIDDVSKSLADANVIVSAGRFEDRHKLYITLFGNRLATPDDLRAVVLKGGQSAAAGLVSLGQVAQVRTAPQPQYIKVTAQGRQAVLINVRQSPGR